MCNYAQCALCIPLCAVPQVKNVCVNVQDSSPTLKVDWQAIARPNVSYTVKYSDQEGEMNTPPVVDVKDVVVTGTSAKLTGLQRGTTYYIWVVAVSNGVEGPHSDRIEATTCELDRVFNSTTCTSLLKCTCVTVPNCTLLITPHYNTFNGFFITILHSGM